MSCYDYPMHRSRKLSSNQATQRTAVARRGRPFFVLIIVALLVVATLAGLRLFDSQQPAVIKIAPPVVAPVPAAPTVSGATLQAHPLPTRDPQKYRIGIVAGHKGYDPGAVCEDGLTEAEVNYAAAREVVELLARRGLQVDLLDEFDDRLADYQANALVSIHADSCNVPGATGFKAARVTNSAIPEAEDRLVTCLNQKYAEYTGLPQHPASITDNMTNYHAFNEIAPLTPGAIIETGFLLDDREILERRPKVVARGIAAGILCFLGENLESEQTISP